MKVLLLKRQEWGGIATHVRDLAQGLAALKIEAVVEDATPWMPKETGPKNDKPVSKELAARSAGFDLVHAFGYRTAWACSAAFGSKRTWLYTAWDMPKTRHPLLVARLNDAAAGLCTARAVLKALDAMLVMNLEMLTVGVREPGEGPDRTAARAEMGLEHEPFVVAGAGRWVPERGFDALIRAMEEVWSTKPDTTLLLAGAGPEEDELRRIASLARSPEKVRFLGMVDSPRNAMAAADVFVVPSRRAGTSMAALEAMALGTPVLLRDTGGLSELVDPDLSGMVFDTDEQLGATIGEMLGLPLTLESLGGAGRVAASERFLVARNADRTANVYRGLLKR